MTDGRGQVDKKPSGAGPGHDEGGADVSRRPSKRQQEKAPEGRVPHVPAAEDGAEHDAHDVAQESRFKEGL